MRVIIQPDYELASKWAAHYIAKKINDFGPAKTKPFLLGLPTGSSPLGMYKELIKLNSAKKVTFKNVITFNMDEYVGLPEDHPASYHYYMRNNFFNHIDIPAKNINILDGNAKNLEAECERYEKKMKRLGGVELFIGGVGPDGHIAFNEPGSSLAGRTRVKTLTQDTIIANSRFFGDDVNKVPKTPTTPASTPPPVPAAPKPKTGTPATHRPETGRPLPQWFDDSKSPGRTTRSWRREIHAAADASSTRRTCRR